MVARKLSESLTILVDSIFSKFRIFFSQKSHGHFMSRFQLKPNFRNKTAKSMATCNMLLTATCLSNVQTRTSCG